VAELSQQSATVRSRFASTITFLVMLFLLTPLVVVILFSFHRTDSLALPFKGFSLRWYRTVFSDPSFRDAMLYTLRVAVSAVVIVVPIGTLAAYSLNVLGPKAAAVVRTITFLPFVFPLLFIGLSMRTVYVYLHIPLQFGTIVAGHCVYVLPYFVLVVGQALSRLDPAVLDAARTLGANPVRVFFKVVLPQVMPVIIVAAVLCMALSLDEFAITYWVAGPDQTMPMFLFGLIRRVVNPSINAASTTLMMISLIMFTGCFFALQRTMARGQAVDASADEKVWT
jgi:spermidine/putrescine transport system permease protein